LKIYDGRSAHVLVIGRVVSTHVRVRVVRSGRATSRGNGSCTVVVGTQWRRRRCFRARSFSVRPITSPRRNDPIGRRRVDTLVAASKFIVLFVARVNRVPGETRKRNAAGPEDNGPAIKSAVITTTSFNNVSSCYYHTRVHADTISSSSSSSGAPVNSDSR